MVGFLKLLFKRTPDPDPEPDAPQGFKRLPPPADADGYAQTLAFSLSTHSDHAHAQMRGALAQLPEKVKKLHFGIHPDKDGEGTFPVLLHPVGTDIHVLNKAIAEYRHLFDIRRVPGGSHPDLPVMVFCEDDYGNTPRWLQKRPT